MEIAPVHQRHLGGRSPQSFGRVEPSETAPDDGYAMAQDSRPLSRMRLIFRKSRYSERFSGVSRPSRFSPSMTRAADPLVFANASERSMSGGTRRKFRSIAAAT